MKMLFFVVTASCIRSKKVRLHAKSNGDLRSIEMKFFIKFRIKAADLAVSTGISFCRACASAWSIIIYNSSIFLKYKL